MNLGKAFIAAIIVTMLFATSAAMGACGVNLNNVNWGGCGNSQSSCWVTANIYNPCNIQVNVWATLSLSVPGGGTKTFNRQQIIEPTSGTSLQIPYTIDPAWPKGTYRACVDVYPFDKISQICGTIQVDSGSSSGSGQSTSQFKITSGYYSETDDLNQAVKSEFGNNYRVADWNEVADDMVRTYDGNIEHWADRIGMKHNENYFVTWDGKGFWNGGNRHYFITRFDSVVDNNYLVHSSLFNNFITLGSWYDIKERILAIRKGPIQQQQQQTQPICDCSGCPYGGICNNVTGKCYCNQAPSGGTVNPPTANATYITCSSVCPYGGTFNTYSGKCDCNAPPEVLPPDPEPCNCPCPGGYCDQYGQCICPEPEPEVLPPEDCPTGCFYDWNVGVCACPADEPAILGGV